MGWMKYILVGLLSCLYSISSFATKYDCNNNHSLMVTNGEVVLDTTDVYYPDTYANGYKLQKDEKTKVEIIPLFKDNSLDLYLIQVWSKKLGYEIRLARKTKDNRDWDYNSQIRCTLSNPNEEPPVPPLQLN